MDVNLFRNGYSIQRRKMDIQNPKHNLKSTFDMNWEKSFDDRRSGILQRKKQSSKQEAQYFYNKSINRKIEEEAKLNKSSFRVMPSPEPFPKKDRYRDSLHDEVSNFDRIRKQKQSNEVHEERGSVGNKAIPHYSSFKKQSYLSLVLGDRLGCYLPSDKHSAINFH